ncbi:hypothetical protein UPYG_G00061700 [Umbra pygmaea]|uniref:Uncharacterized protein n=1 Tax=Umbra pygmaea TaxID=75934 RepID=A0ABD0XA51_UMBPY
MSKTPTPVPQLRSLFLGKSEEGEPLERRSYGTPSPLDTPGPEFREGRKPPPLPQKNWPLRQMSLQEGCSDTIKRVPHGKPVPVAQKGREMSLPEGGCANEDDGGVTDKIKMFEAEMSHNKQVMGRPLLKAPFIFHREYSKPPPFQHVLVAQKIHLDADNLLEWWGNVKDESWEDLVNDPKHTKEGDEKQFTLKAERVLNAVQLYNLLLNTHGETMKNQITELNGIADNLDMVSKGTKIAGITGGATGAVGGVAAVAGVMLAPLTFGASLAITAVGVGVAAAGGVTGASAAIANKVSGTYDRNKIEQILQNFQEQMGNIEACLTFIKGGMEQLKKQNISTLQGMNTRTFSVAKMDEVTGMGSASAIEASSKASGVLKGFAMGMDIYFTKNKDGKGEAKLNKRFKSEFAGKIRDLAKNLDEGLDEFFKVKEDLVKNNLII